MKRSTTPLVVASKLLLGAALVLTTTSAQAGESSVLETAINIPDGPASIEGFGQGYDVSPSSGLPSLSYPISVPPGRVGLQPSLSLNYEAGGGSSLYGLGWSMGAPSIELSLREGIPLYSGSDQLTLRGLGASEELIEVAPGEWREEIEGASPVIVRQSGQGFEAWTTSGMRYVFGTGAGARTEGPNGTFAWKLEAMIDTSGNRVEYIYETLPGTTEPVCSRIEWNNGFAAVSFEYEARPDRLQSRSAGFARTTQHRLKSIVTEADHQDVQIWTLQYANTNDVPSSMLVAIESEAATDGERVPTWRMTYAAMAGEDPEAVTMSSSLGIDPTADGFAWVDVDGDALPDLLRGNAGAWEWKRNQGGESFSDWTPAAQSPSVTLGPDAKWADLNGDGVGDLVHQVGVGSDLLTFMGGGADPFSTSDLGGAQLSFSLNDPRTQMVDVNVDGRVDVMFMNDTDTFVRVRNYEGGGWTPNFQTSVVEDGMRLGDPGVQMADLQGDRLPDLVRIMPSDDRVLVAEAIGFGQFLDPVDMEGVPTMNATDRWELRDFNGDGSADLIRVGESGLDIWTNKLDGSFNMAKGMTWDDLGVDEKVIFSDVNANGTLDVLRVDPIGGTWRYWDVMGRQPGLLDHYENGLGYSIDFSYSSAAAMAWEDMQAGEAWTGVSPNAMPLVVESVERDGWDWESTKTHRFRDGYYDRYRGEFRGFAEHETSRLGDEYVETATTLTTYDLGQTEEAMKLKSLTSELRGEDGVFNRSETTWEVFDQGDGRKVARSVASDSYSIENGPESEAKRTRSESVYDEWGNVLSTREMGFVELDSGIDIPGDERVSESTFAQPTTNDGPVDRVAESATFDGEGTLFSKSQYYYDGDAGEGLPLGQVGKRGLETRVRRWVEEDTWLTRSRLTYDVYGNPVQLVDAVGGTMRRTYDDLGRFPESEALELDETSPLEELRSEMVWRADYGVMSRVVRPTGAATDVVYDGLGRVTALIRPGDDPALPGVKYDYFLDGDLDPHPAIRTSKLSSYGEDAYEISVDQLDGLGRLRQRITENDAGDGAVLASAVRFDAAGGAALSWSGFDTERSMLEPGATVTIESSWPHSQSWTDASGRGYRSLSVEGRESRTTFEPYVTISRGNADITQADGYADTPNISISDGLGRTTEIREQLSDREITHRREYDTLDRLIAEIDPAGNRTEYDYDGESRVTQVRSPDAGTLNLEYDEVGRITRRLDPRGATVEYDYDVIGRALAEHSVSPAGVEGTVRYFYDAPTRDDVGEFAEFSIGKLTGTQDDAGRVDLDYDALGRVIRTTRTFELESGDRVLSHAAVYDPQDRITETHFPDGTTLPHTYSKRGFELSVGEFVPTIEYNALGQLQALHMANGAVHHREHDREGRVLNQQVTASDNTLLDLVHTYDTAGLLRRTEDRVGDTGVSASLTQEFRYDDLMRLTSAQADYGQLSWAYSDDGNILSQAGKSLRYESARPHAATALDDQLISYDTGGNIAKVEGEGALEAGTWTFDAYNRAQRFENEDGRVVENIYDATGARAIKREYKADGKLKDEVLYFGASEVRDGKLVRWVRAGGMRVAESPSEPPKKDGEPIPVPAGAIGLIALVEAIRRWRARNMATRGSPPPRSPIGGRLGLAAACLAVMSLVGVGVSGCKHNDGGGATELVPDEHTRWHVQDRLDSASLILDHEAQVIARAAHTPYGEDWIDWQASADVKASDYRFTDKEEDDVIGAVHFPARYYLPALGRWASADPLGSLPGDLGPEDWNAYNYVRGNPIGLIDPTGLCPSCRLAERVNEIAATGDTQRASETLDAHGAVAKMWMVSMVPTSTDDIIVAIATAGVGHLAYKTLKFVGGLMRGADTAADVAQTASRAANAADTALDAGSAASKSSSARRSLLDQARDARDAKATELGPLKAPDRPATVTAGYNKRTGEVAVGCSGGGTCAETKVVEQLGGNPSEVQLTEAVRPRPQEPPFKQVPVCENCEATYGRDAFPEGTTEFKSDK